MARYLVKFNELKLKNDYERKLINKIEECKYNIENAKSNLDWEGPASNKFIINLDNYVNELNNMIEKLKICLNVTEKYYTNYGEGYQNIKKGFANLQEEMVNGWKKQR